MLKKITYPILIILFSVFAIIPLIQPGYFSNHEEFFPMFRLYELYRSLQAGYIFPRWGPDWAFGFGYPFFNFYAPFSYYFAAFWHWLGFNLVDSVKTAFGASVVLSGLIMYLWAKEFWGRAGGLISAAVYMYLPYRLTDIYIRGNLAESFAFIWLPLILYATHKVLRSNNNRIAMNDGLLLSISFAALILTHNLTAIYFLPIMIGYALWACITTRDFKPLLRVTCYMSLALALSAFFSFPALYDARFVRTQDMIQMWYLPIRFLWSNVGHTEHFDFLKQQFYPVHGILGVSGFLIVAIKYTVAKFRSTKICHSGKLDPGFRRNDTETYWNNTGAHFLLATFSIAMIIILTFFITPFSQLIWETLPKQFQYIQFSWRLLIFVGAFVSFLCGSILQLFNLSFLYKQESRLDPPFRGDDAWSLAISILFTILIIVSTLPRLQNVYALNTMSDNDITVEKSWDWDRQFGTIGNTAQSEYLPRWVDKDKIKNQKSKIKSDFIETKKINLEKDDLVTFETFYFPGWQASVDSIQLPTFDIQPQEKTGFIQVPVPAGEHEVKIWFGSTPWRRWSEAVSIISLIGLISLISLIGLKNATQNK